ncbi:MAG TPA: hypothetical protein VME47_16735 [Acetobacteraceae bacterium]|nr:hypothetical protein [Acetobacteraceae bacterium]
MAAGLIFTFLAVSLATGAIVEALASIVNLRASTLLTGVKQLVNDPNFAGLAKTLYEHALINPRGPGVGAAQQNKPSYIAPAQFASAMMDAAGLSRAIGQASAAVPGKELAAELQAALNAALPPERNVQLNALLQGIIQRAGGESAKIHKELADWFDNAMDRVSGTYKRYTQLIGCIVALLLCIACNIDALHIARAVYAHPFPDQLAEYSQQPDAVVALNILETSFPVGWPDGQLFSKIGANGTPVDFTRADCIQAITGWLITVLATLFGAPFWFDLLQGFVRLKGSGPSPAEKASGQAAAS